MRVFFASWAPTFPPFLLKRKKIDDTIVVDMPIVTIVERKPRSLMRYTKSTHDRVSLGSCSATVGLP